jgi:hypothetical protein
MSHEENANRDGTTNRMTNRDPTEATMQRYIVNVCFVDVIYD